MGFYRRFTGIVRGCVPKSYFQKFTTNQLNLANINQDEDCSVLTKIKLDSESRINSTISMCACNLTRCNLGYEPGISNPNELATLSQSPTQLKDTTTESHSLTSADNFVALETVTQATEKATTTNPPQNSTKSNEDGHEIHINIHLMPQNHSENSAKTASMSLVVVLISKLLL